MTNSWDDIRSDGTWDYINLLYATWDDLLTDTRNPDAPPPPPGGSQAGITPDLAGMSLGGAYQAGLLAGFAKFAVIAYRQTWMADSTFYFREVSPALGYVNQTTTPGTGWWLDDPDTRPPVAPPNGSFFTDLAELGVPDQYPEPGEDIAVHDTLCFVFQVPDNHPTPSLGDLAGGLDVGYGVDDTGTVAWWCYEFSADAIPGALLPDIVLYNGPPVAPVTILDVPEIARNPLVIFTAPPTPEPVGLIEDVPQFERQSYEINAVLRAVDNELARIRAAQAAMILNWFPLTADAMLDRFESMLGLPTDPATENLVQRRNIVLAYMRRLRSEGGGLDWEANMDSLAGTGTWSYAEHNPADPESPPAYTVNVAIPQVLARVGWSFVRDITPAHLAINESYTGGWLVGESLLDIDPL